MDSKSRAGTPPSYSTHPVYNPSAWPTPPPQDREEEGTLVLVDENGNQVGALGEHISVAGVVPGSHEPVEIDLSRTDGIITYHISPVRHHGREIPRLHRSYTNPESSYLQPLSAQRQNAAFGRASTFPIRSPEKASGPPHKVRPTHSEYLQDSQDPVYANSRIVGTAATAARVLVTGATYVSKAVESGAKTFTEKTKPVNTPMTFQPTTHNYVRQVHNFSASGAHFASRTVGVVTHHAQNFGARLAGKSDGHQPSKPGLLNKGMVAFGTIADGIDYASKLILRTSSQATTTIVGHRYGQEAEEVARGLTGVVKNVGLVYIDATGVSRRAVVKSVAKGMVVGRVKGGGEVVFQGSNSSQAVFSPPTSQVHSPPPSQAYSPPPSQVLSPPPSQVHSPVQGSSSPISPPQYNPITYYK